jgi:hypothetical protein
MIIIEPVDLWCIFRRTHLGFSVGWGLVWVCGYTWCPKISWLLVYFLNNCLLHFDIAHINQLGIVWGTNLSEFDPQMTKTVEHCFKHRNCFMIITGFLPPKKLGEYHKIQRWIPLHHVAKTLRWMDVSERHQKYMRVNMFISSYLFGICGLTRLPNPNRISNSDVLYLQHPWNNKPMCISFWNKISRDFRITSCPTLVCFKQFFDPPFGRAKKYVNTKIQHGHLRVSHSDKPKKSSDWWWKMMEAFLWSGGLEHEFYFFLSLSLSIYIWDNPSHLIFCKMVETTNRRWLKPSSGLLTPYSSRLCLGPKCC